MKIQLKRSNVLQSGSAKKPSSDQMEYGELAVNYNQTDPAIFIKDSNGNIIRIAGGESIGNEGYPDIGDGLGATLDNRYVNVTGDTMTGALNVPAGASGTEVPQIQEVVKKTGDTMTGNLDVIGAKVTSDSTLDSDSGRTLVTKDYVDNSTIGYPDTDDGDGATLDARYVKVVGDTMTGNLALPGGGGDTEALQKQEIEALIDASDTGTDKYVEIAGDTMTGNLTLPGGGGDTDALQKQEIEELIEIEIDAIDTSSVNSGPTFPPTGEENELFFNTTDGRLYIYYNDGSSEQWIDASPDSVSGYVEKTGDTMTGNLDVVGAKVTSASTVSGDAGTTLTTKDYVDSKSVIGVAAWGRFRAGITEIIGSYNIASIVKGGGDNVWDVTLINPLPSEGYAVTATVNEQDASSNNAYVRVREMRTTGFRISTHNGSDGTPANGVGFGFAVFAQTSL